MLDSRKAVQRGLDRLDVWAEVSRMRLSPKCWDLHCNHNNSLECYRLREEWLENYTKEKDLRLPVDSS